MRRLSAFRRDRLERELREFFLHEPGAVTSNFGGIAALALSGVRSAAGNPFGGDNAHDRMIAICRAVDRYAEKRRAYLALEDRYQRVLWLAFGPHKLPPEWRKALGYTAAAALVTDAAKEGCKRASGAVGEPTPAQIGAWLTRACAKNGKVIVEIAAERDQHIDEALVAYDEAKRDSKASEDDEMTGEKIWGWKEIAKRLGVEERTARRYAEFEEDRLPVYKDTRSGKVFAIASELDAWRERGFVPARSQADVSGIAC